MTVTEDIDDDGFTIDLTREEMGYAPLAPDVNPSTGTASDQAPAPTPSAPRSGPPKPVGPPLPTTPDGRVIFAGAAPPPPAPHYPLLTLDQLFDMKSPPWLVHCVIRQGEFVVIYGEPSCGKTFVALDLGLKIAAKLDWWSYRTFGGGVLYLAGEGAYGLKNRVQAWDQTRDPKIDVRPLPVRILPLAVSFMDEGAFKHLLETLKAEFPKPSAIIVDTLARHLVGGDENSAEDMGLFVSRCAKLQVVTGATVIAIHHTAKNGEFERGSSALRGAADVMIQVTKSDDRITLRGDKAKDADRLEPIHLEFERVWLGDDEFGKAIYSLVLRSSNSPRAKRDEAAESDPGRLIRETLAKFFDGPASGSALKDESGLPKSTFYRVLQDEQNAGLIGRVQDGKVRRYFLKPDAPEYVAPRPTVEPEVASPIPTESHESHGNPSGTEGTKGGQSQVPVPPTPLGVGVGRDWDCTDPATSSLHPGEKKEKRRPRNLERAKPNRDEASASTDRTVAP